jgi:hypothetical protein
MSPSRGAFRGSRSRRAEAALAEAKRALIAADPTTGLDRVLAHPGRAVGLAATFGVVVTRMPRLRRALWRVVKRLGPAGVLRLMRAVGRGEPARGS